MINLEKTLRVQTSSYKNKNMLRYIKKQLSSLGASYDQDKHGNIYATKGEADTYVCAVAHTDTVHKLVPKANFKIYTDKNILFSVDTRTYKRCGIGGDDKVGVYVALHIMSQMDAFKCAFFVDEEVGCVGSSHADVKFFDDVILCVQADRKGVREITSSINGTEMYSDAFGTSIAHIIKTHNFVEVNGGTTDVGELGDKLLSIPMFNVACGYYLPHSSDEYVNTIDVDDTIAFLRDVIDFVIATPPTDTWTRPEYSYGYGNTLYGGWDAWDYGGYGKSIKKPIKNKFRRKSYENYKWDDKRACWVDKDKKDDDKISCQVCDGTMVDTYQGDAWCRECGSWQQTI